MWSYSGPHFGLHIWTQKWGQPSENFAAARTCCASRFATLQLEHECQLIPFSLCASQVRLLLYVECFVWHLLMLGKLKQRKPQCESVMYLNICVHCTGSGSSPSVRCRFCFKLPTSISFSPHHPLRFCFWNPHSYFDCNIPHFFVLFGRFVRGYHRWNRGHPAHNGPAGSN